MKLSQITKNEINIQHIIIIQFHFNIYHLQTYSNVSVGVWVVGCMCGLMGVNMGANIGD